MKFIILSLIAFPSISMATLGGDLTSVDADIQSLQGQYAMTALDVTLPAGFKVATIKAGLVTIKEFSDPSGKIFAVSWRGFTEPDLKPLLGKYFAEYADADQKMPKGHRFLRHPVSTGKVTVIHGGHQRDLRGLAFVGTLPDGITTENLQ